MAFEMSQMEGLLQLSSSSSLLLVSFCQAHTQTHRHKDKQYTMSVCLWCFCEDGLWTKTSTYDQYLAFSFSLCMPQTVVVPYPNTILCFLGTITIWVWSGTVSLARLQNTVNGNSVFSSNEHRPVSTTKNTSCYKGTLCSCGQIQQRTVYLNGPLHVVWCVFAVVICSFHHQLVVICKWTTGPSWDTQAHLSYCCYTCQAYYSSTAHMQLTIIALADIFLKIHSHYLKQLFFDFRQR